MLLELFSEFTIDSGDNRDVESSDRCNITFLNPSLYVPFDQSAEWFSSKNLDLDNLDVRRTQEIFQNQAVLAYFRGDYITAMDIYLKMSENETLRTGDFAVTDSLIRCGLKLSPINGPQLLAWLEKLNKLVSTYGEQLQYWTLSLHVYLATGTNSTEYLRNAILLCASVDHPYHWTLLSHALPLKASMHADSRRQGNKGAEAMYDNPFSGKCILQDNNAQAIVIRKFICCFHSKFSDVRNRIVEMLL